MARLTTLVLIVMFLPPGEAEAQGRGIQQIGPAAIRQHFNAYDAVKAYGDGRWVQSCHSVSVNEAPQRPGTGWLRDVPTEFITGIDLIPFDYSHELVRRGARCGTVVLHLVEGMSRDSLNKIAKERREQGEKPETTSAGDRGA